MEAAAAQSPGTAANPWYPSATKVPGVDPARASRSERGFTRRRLLVAAGAGAGGLAPAADSLGRAPSGREVADIVLRPRSEEVELGRRRVRTSTYDGRLPGQELRLRQGRPVRTRVEHALEEPTTIHWHGVRL